MSRIGKQPVVISEGVTIKEDGRDLTITGPKGELSVHVPYELNIAIEGNQLTVTPKNEEDKFSRSLWGTYQRLIENSVKGVSEGFTRVLEFNGVGWRAETQNKKLVLNVGYSQPVNYAFPEGIDIAVEKNTITISGIDKQQVGQIAAEIRAVRKPEPYKGKGIKYQEEVIRRKAGKQAKSSS